MSTREAVIRDGRIVGYVHQEQTAGHQLSALPSKHYTATRADGPNLGRVFWTAAEAAAALEAAP